MPANSYFLCKYSQNISPNIMGLTNICCSGLGIGGKMVLANTLFNNHDTSIYIIIHDIYIQNIHAV